jgi:hypothetical protein
MKPKPFALRYTKMRVYGNHYRVNEGGAETTMANYDLGVASIFQQPQATHEGTTLGSIQYVGVLKDLYPNQWYSLNVIGLHMGLTDGVIQPTNGMKMVFYWQISTT